jgi:hypothetical protein
LAVVRRGYPKPFKVELKGLFSTGDIVANGFMAAISRLSETLFTSEIGVRPVILQFVIDVMIGTKTVGEKRPHIILT